MQRIDLFGFYRLGQYVHPAAELGKPALMLNKISSAGLFLRLFAEPPHEPLPLKLAAVAANDVLNAQADIASRFAMKVASNRPPTDATEDLYYKAAIESAERAVYAFEAVLEKELLTTPAFLVSPKGAYDTFILLERADAAISDSVRPFVPDDAIRDFREAARALVLEVPTACGFHVTRAVEAVLRNWHALVIQNSTGAEPAKTKGFQIGQSSNRSC